MRNEGDRRSDAIFSILHAVRLLAEGVQLLPEQMNAQGERLGLVARCDLEASDIEVLESVAHFLHDVVAVTEQRTALDDAGRILGQQGWPK